MDLWRIMTPLGFPVEPEVNSTLIRSSGPAMAPENLLGSSCPGMKAIFRSSFGRISSVEASQRILSMPAVRTM